MTRAALVNVRLPLESPAHLMLGDCGSLLWLRKCAPNVSLKYPSGVLALVPVVTHTVSI